MILTGFPLHIAYFSKLYHNNLYTVIYHYKSVNLPLASKDFSSKINL